MGLVGIEESNSEFPWRLLFLSNSSIVITDATKADNPIAYVNPAFESLTGYTKAECIGRNCRFLQGNDQDQSARHILASAVNMGVGCACVVRNYRKNGELFWNQLHMFPLKDNSGSITHYVGIQHDASSERILLNALREKQRMIDSSHDVFLKIAADSTILEVNVACEAIFGWKPEDLVGRSTKCLLASDQESDIMELLRTLLLESTSQSVTEECVRKDGATVLLEWTVIPSSDGETLLAVGRDVTERRRLEFEALKSSAHVKAVLNSITEGCYALNRQWICTYINKKGAESLSVAEEQLIGRNIWEALPDAVGGEFYTMSQTAMSAQHSGHAEQYYSGRWYEARVYPSEEGLTVFFLDITQRKINEQALLYSATHDSLTGLYNRRSCLTTLNQLLLADGIKRAHLAVLFIDLDHFKEVNDAFGHQVGDSVIKKIGSRLGDFANEHSVVTRISGDEFVVILSNANAGEAKAVASRILRAIEQPISTGKSDVVVGASIGIAMAGTGNVSADDVINQADTAMYISKAKGRHGVTVFSVEVDDWSKKRHSLRQDMSNALRESQFVLHYQPQVRLIDGKVVGAEALIRWQHPEFGLLPPAAFIELAEETPFIVELGTWVLDEACRQASHWQTLGHELKISVNVSIRQLADVHLADQMETIINKYGVSPRCIKLEVTESMLAQDFEVAANVLGRLKQKGFRIALDDFGTGYSNLAYINKLPITAIKIDRSFVNGIDTDKGALALINAIVSLAKSLDLSVVCEGVETVAQRVALESTRCDTIQGYLVSRPLPAFEFFELFLLQR